MSSSRYTFVALFYIASAVVLTLVLDKAFSGILAVANVADTEILGERFTLSTFIALLLSAGGASYAWMNKRAKEFCAESVDELGKVSWPEASETKMNTVVVVIFSFIAAGILGVFDSVFGWLTRNNLFLF